MAHDVAEEREFWRKQAEGGLWRANVFGAVSEADWKKRIKDELALIEPAMKGSVGVRKKARILELGVGIGRLAIPLAKKLGEAVTVVGVDISEAALGEALVSGNKAGVSENFEVYLSDGRSIPEEVGKVHGAYCVFMFQHLPWEAVRSYLAQVSDLLIKGCLFRFQYVEGEEEPSFLSNHFRYEDVERELHQYTDLRIVDVDRGALHEKWSWITARKG